MNQFTTLSEARPVRLTPKQLVVFQKLRKGKQNKVIAHELGLAEITVKTHIHSIMKKLGAHTRTELVYMLRDIPFD